MGRKSLEVINQERIKLGLPIRKRKKTIYKKKPKSNAILPESKKKRSQEILATMLSTAGDKVVKKVLNKALDDDDKDQVVCLKMVMDRVIPQDYLTKAKGSGNKIEIQISGVDSPVNINEVNTIEGQADNVEEG
jgi:hypothetical protein